MNRKSKNGHSRANTALLSELTDLANSTLILGCCTQGCCEPSEVHLIETLSTRASTRAGAQVAA